MNRWASAAEEAINAVKPDERQPIWSVSEPRIYSKQAGDLLINFISLFFILQISFIYVNHLLFFFFFFLNIFNRSHFTLLKKG